MKTRNSTIAICALLTLAFGVASSIEREKSLPKVRFWVGFAVAFTGFSILNDLKSSLGPALAVLFTTTAVITYGEDAVKLFSERVGKDPKTKSETGFGAGLGAIGASTGGGALDSALTTVKDLVRF